MKLLNWAATRFNHTDNSLVRALSRGWRALLSNPLRSLIVNRQRDRVMKSIAWQDVQQTVVILVPGMNKINGGILSIVSITEESRKVCSARGAKVFACTLPGDPPLFKYTLFENNESLLGFETVLKQLPRSSELMVHIPEVYVPRFLAWARNHDYLEIPRVLRINVLLQNIDLCPSTAQMQELSALGILSCTTAHVAYATTEVQMRLGCPLHHLSTNGDPSNYERRVYADKTRTIVYSPDADARKNEVLALVKKELPEYELVEIAGLKYADFRSLILRARFSISFGEGMDGYYIEPIFSGSIGCAVYNTRFFPANFKGTDFVYDSWDDLISKLVQDIRKCEDPQQYSEVNERQYSRLAQIYSYPKYVENIRSFYETFLPARQPGSNTELRIGRKVS